MPVRAFGTQERNFKLLGAQWRDLEKARDAGLGVIASRLAPIVSLKQSGGELYPGGIFGAIAAGQLGTARLDDVREPILQGLIGGGMTSTEAGALVRKVFDEGIDGQKGAMLLWCDLAFEIVINAIVGLEDEPEAGEPEAVATPLRRRRSKTEKPASENFTAP
jgi:hypothetical protein